MRVWGDGNLKAQIFFSIGWRTRPQTPPTTVTGPAFHITVTVPAVSSLKLCTAVQVLPIVFSVNTIFFLIGQCQGWFSQPETHRRWWCWGWCPASEDGVIKRRHSDVPQLKLRRPSNFFSDFSLVSLCWTSLDGMFARNRLLSFLTHTHTLFM